MVSEVIGSNATGDEVDPLQQTHVIHKLVSHFDLAVGYEHQKMGSNYV